jgi:beta-lactamase regulating signal transducer with metallopeptidase domain
MTATIVHMNTAFLMTLASAAVRSLALGLFAAAALAAFRTKSVRVKLFVWKGVLFAALAMPALIQVSPAVRVAVPVPSLPERSEAASPKPVPGGNIAVVASLPAIPLKKTPKTSTRVREQAQFEPAPTIVQSSLPVAIASLAALREIPWTLIIESAYMAIALALLVRVGIGILFSNRLVRLATPVDEPWALRSLAAAAHAAGLRAIPRLAESESVSVPVMVGVVKPTILLTEGWQAWAADELAAVLAHEVSHVARRDALTQRLALIHRAVFWFSPLAWWLERHLADLAEQASDEAALAGGADRTRYAETLLGFFAELEAGPGRVWWQGVSMAKTGQAEKRVDRILAWRGAMSNQLRKSLVMALVAIAVPVVALTAAVHPAAHDIQAPPAPAAPGAPAAPPAPDSAAPAPNPGPSPSQAPAPPAPPVDTDDATFNVHVAVPPLPPIPPLHIEVPAINVDVPPLHVAVPQIHIETRALQAMPQQDIVVQPPMTFSMSGDWNFYRGGRGGYWVGRYYGWGPRFAIVAKDSDELTMSGDRDDAEHARALKKKIPGDFIWFERDDKSYIVSDQATVARAKQLWEPNLDLEKQQRDLRKQQEELGRQAEDAARKIEEMKIKVPDLTAEMQKVEEAMKKLNAEGGTMNEIGELQRQMGEIQREIGEAQRDAGRTAGQMGREQGEWGRKMGEIGRKQAEQAREASRQMQQLLDDAVAHGLAKPE